MHDFDLLLGQISNIIKPPAVIKTENQTRHLGYFIELSVYNIPIIWLAAHWDQQELFLMGLLHIGPLWPNTHKIITSYQTQIPLGVRAPKTVMIHFSLHVNSDLVACRHFIS